MALLSSVSPAPTTFYQSNAPTRTASLSGTQLGQAGGGPSRGATNRQSSSRSLVKFESDRASLQDDHGSDNGLVNGGTGHVASSESNDNSFKPQNVSRARTENHQSLAHRPKALMTRSKTCYEPENIPSKTYASVEEHGELRHGWEDEYNSSEFLGQLNSVYFPILCHIYRIWFANTYCRLFTCTSPINDMRVVESRKRATN